LQSYSKEIYIKLSLKNILIIKLIPFQWGLNFLVQIKMKDLINKYIIKYHLIIEQIFFYLKKYQKQYEIIL